ncbi:MAG: hypothetical protein ACREE6_16830 [Limisphaerales bacterium]
MVRQFVVLSRYYSWIYASVTNTVERPFGASQDELSTEAKMVMAEKGAPEGNFPFFGLFCQ